MEVWKDIPGYEGLYQASNQGRIKSLPKRKGKGNGYIKEEEILKASVEAHGYERVVLGKDGKKKKYQVHRLIAATFIPNEENKQQVNHINGNKADNRVENLEWCTDSENMQHAFQNGLINIPTRSVIQLDLQGTLIKEWDSITEAEAATGVRRGNIWSCCVGKRKTANGYKWKYKEA